MVIIQSLVNRSEHRLSRSSTLLNPMRSISQDLRLHNRHQPILLAYNRITRKSLRVLLNRQLRRLGGSDLQHRAPLSEPGTSLVELLASRAERIESLGGGFAISAG